LDLEGLEETSVCGDVTTYRRKIRFIHYDQVRIKYEQCGDREK